jgi:hypothetical protein
MTDEDIELSCDWQGSDGEFVKIAAEVGFLDGHRSDRAIHDWATHNPWVANATRRSEAAKSAAESRWNNRLGCKSHYSAMPSASIRNAPSPSPSPSPSPNPKSKEEAQHSRRGTRLPEGWQPSELLRAWASKEHPGVDVPRALDEFRDYWEALPGSRACKLDWEKTFKNRIRDLSTHMKGSSNGTRRESASERVARINADAEDREYSGEWTLITPVGTDHAPALAPDDGNLRAQVD